MPFFSVIYTINSRVLCVACVFDAKRFGQCGWTKRALNSNVSCYYSPIYIIILLIVHEEVELSAPSTEKNTIESRLLHTEQIIASQCLFLLCVICLLTHRPDVVNSSNSGIRHKTVKDTQKRVFRERPGSRCECWFQLRAAIDVY